MHTPLRRFIKSTHSYRARAHALHATTSSCVITPTATTYAPHNLHPCRRTGHIRDVASYTYNIHAHIPPQLCMRVLFAFTSRAQCTTERDANHAQRNVPYCDAACAPQRTALTYANSFIFSFILFLVHLTVVVSLNAPTCFVSDKGATVGNSVSNHVQTTPASALGEVRAPFETKVSATSHYRRIDSGTACLTSLRLDV